MATKLEQALFELTWPVNRLGELVETLARKTGLSARPLKLPQPSDRLQQADEETLGRWIDTACGYLGLEADPVNTQYHELALFLRGAAPAILRLPVEPGSGQNSLVGLVRCTRRNVYLLSPELRIRRLPLETLRTALAAPYEGGLTPAIDRLLREAGVPEERLAYARRAVLYEQLNSAQIPAGWMLRVTPGASLQALFRHYRVFPPLAGTLFLYLIQQVLALGTWFVIGRGVFQGHFDLGWLLAWVILLFSTIPVSILVSDAQTELSMSVGSIFKQRLLYGTLKLEPDEIRSQGIGQFLSRVMESEAVEFLAMNGGFLALLSFIELGLAGFILANGAGGGWSAAILLGWVLLTVLFLWNYYGKSRDWMNAYRQMTNDLVENMVGHRTRLAQEDRRHWHDGEDLALDRYLNLSEEMDRIGIQLRALINRGWLVVGLFGVVVPFISGGVTPQKLAISLGGVLFASQALNRLTGGVQSFISLVIAWEQVGPLFKAAQRPREIQSLDLVSQDIRHSATSPDQFPTQGNSAQPLLLVRDLTFRYRPAGHAVIQDCDLVIQEGDRVLLEGPSGGGKSTLAALITGLRRPESGSLLLWGYDRQILGVEEWRRRVVMAPQFQENYVFSETLGFNLLMGRRWPARKEDLREAEALCRQLGLGEVIDRMPSGFQQMLGESGWQLSHGERSRLFIARTLLQNADLVVLDESFGALDPENLYRALRTVLQRAPTLLVIAHP